MPFPLAHPAAVLPLRRYCPRYLSFPALVVGSVCPDAGYCLGRFNLGEFSHQWIGSFGFSLPVGIIILLVLYGVVLPIVDRLPARFGRIVPTSVLRPLGPPLIVVFSLLVGAWSHVLWDSFTRTNGWFVENLPLLKTPLISLENRTVRICHLLWYSSSFAGLILLFIAYDRWRQKTLKGASATDIRVNWRGAVLLAILVVPIEVIHHLTHGPLGSCLVLALTLGVVIGFAWKLRPAEENGRASSFSHLTPSGIGLRQSKSSEPRKQVRDVAGKNGSVNSSVQADLDRP